MAEVTAPPVTVVALKESAKLLSAFCICRRCLMTTKMLMKPHMAYASPDLCSIKGCENEAAYIVALSPYEFRR